MTKRCSVTSVRVCPMKSASKGLISASTWALPGAGAPIDLKVSTPMMPMTRPLSARAASIATGPPIEWPTRMICLLGTVDSAAATSPPKRAMVQSLRLLSVPPWPARSTMTSVYFRLNGAHLFTPVVRIAGPSVDEHQRRFAAAVHAVLHVHAIRRDRDARRAFGGFALLGGRGWGAGGRRGFLLAAGNDGQSSNESGDESGREWCACAQFKRRTRRSHRWRARK